MGQQNETNTNDAGTTTIDFEKWLAEQPEEVRNAYEAHVSGLKKALASERDSRTKLEKQLKKLAKGEELPDPVKRQIEDLTKQLDVTAKKAKFIAKAAKAGAHYPELLAKAVDIDDLDPAALEDKTFWDNLREEYAALFAPTSVTRSRGGDGGAGENPPDSPPSFDDVIRDLARR